MLFYKLRSIITTYAYDPLIDVLSITPPSGSGSIFIIRLKGLKKSEKNSQVGNLLKEFKYNYKQ
jgi:hypothetical protein